MGLIPSEPRLPVEPIEKYKLLIHGLSGIGKSSFIASVPNCIIADCERGMLAHSGYIVDIDNWLRFVSFVDEVLQRQHTFNMVAIDPLDALYNHCWNHILPLLKVKYPSEAAHGVGWDRITSEFMGQLHRLQMAGFGLVCTAHTMVGTVRIRGVEYSKFQPAFVGGSARSAYQRAIDLFDLIGYMHMETEVKPPKEGKISEMATGQLIESAQRVLDFSASQFWVSKDRGGRLEVVKLPNDWQRDWDALVAAWEGQHTDQRGSAN